MLCRRQFLAAAAGTVFAASTRAQNLLLGAGSAGGITISATTQQFLDRLVTTPTATDKAAYNTFINTLVASGIWAKLDAMWISSALSEVNGRVNLVQPAFPLGRYGTPTFNTDYTGIAGTGGANDFYYSQIVFNGQGAATPRMTQNSASMFAYMTAGAAGGNNAAMLFSNPNMALWPKNGPSNFYWRGLDATDRNIANANATGLFGWSRTGANAVAAYYNGANIDSQSYASVALSGPYLLMNYVGSTLTSATKWAVVGSGAGLTDADMANLYSAIAAYLSAVAGQTGVVATISLGTNTATIVSDGRTHLMGGFEKLSNGNSFCIYLSTPGGIGVSGSDWRYQTTSNPLSWSGTETTLTTGDGTRVPYNLEAKVLANNTIFVVGNFALASTGTSSEIVTYIGAADASSFSGPTVISTSSLFTRGDVSMACKPLILSNSNVVVAIYGGTAASATTSVGLLFFDSTGVSLGNPVLVVDASVYQQPWNETGLFETDDHKIGMIVRSDNESYQSYSGYYLVTSNLDGSNPSAPIEVIIQPNSVGKPAVLKTAAGRVFMWNRSDTSVVKTQWMWSENDGKVWTPPNLYGNGNGSVTQYDYASSYLADANTIASAVSIATNVGSASDIHYQELKQ